MFHGRLLHDYGWFAVYQGRTGPVVILDPEYIFLGLILLIAFIYFARYFLINLIMAVPQYTMGMRMQPRREDWWEWIPWPLRYLYAYPAAALWLTLTVGYRLF